MRRTVIAAALIAAVYGCEKEEPISREQYELGTSEVEGDGCECDPNLSYPDNSVEAQAGLGWIDGYVAACIAYREAHRCD